VVLTEDVENAHEVSPLSLGGGPPGRPFPEAPSGYP
jgi:hypothetical protein